MFGRAVATGSRKGRKVKQDARGLGGPRVLLVEDSTREASLGPLLDTLGWEVVIARGAREALFACDVLTSVSGVSGAPIGVLLDLSSDEERRGLIDSLRSALPRVPVIVVLDEGEAKAAPGDGVFETIRRPVTGDSIMAVLARAMRQARPANTADLAIPGIVGHHGALVDVMKLVAKVAPSLSTALILGETGTGKEIVARAIHALSPRRGGPFIAVNCAAIPEPLLESELFGHEKGAFTGAIARKAGLFERAAAGTLFLDEIGDLPISLQPKILRALQEREVVRVGGDESIPVDVRIVAATHHDLAALCRQNRFREDLYYRLNVFPILLPPLRERASDIPLLAIHFLHRLASESKTEPKVFTRAALERLVRHRWPGNVRELQSAIERASLMSESTEIDVDDLPVEVRDPRIERSERVDFRLPDSGFLLDDFERGLILQAMERSNGVMARAARMLGISYRTLQYRLQKLRVTRR